MRVSLVTFVLLALASTVLGTPLSIQESQRQKHVIAQLETNLAETPDHTQKFALLRKAMAAESEITLRDRMLTTALNIAGPELETFLADMLQTEPDAGLRSKSARLLGERGSEKALAVLAKAASSDRVSPMQIGCMVCQSSARRAATFAIAELAGRFPAIAKKAQAELDAIQVAADPKDNESLADARRQALYQITQDKTLLQPFLDKLKDPDAQERVRGIVAFQFFKLKAAPPELLKALQDPNEAVRSSTALVLGEIGDPKTVEPLMAVAADTKAPRGVRCNAIGSLGHMRAAEAAPLMEKLLTDPDVSGNAAIALYRMTGRKTKQFPQGYNAD